MGARRGSCTGGRAAPLPRPPADAWPDRRDPGSARRRPHVRLPEDHVAHPEYRIEWWYYTGNVRGDDGRAYGYQVTFFRVGVDAAPVNPSAFAVRDLYMAHVAVTDIERRRARVCRSPESRRRALGRRACRIDTRSGTRTGGCRSTQQGRHRVVADAGAFALDLTLEPGKPAVLQGDRGYSRKGQRSGQRVALLLADAHADDAARCASAQRTVAVTGTSWMDHEFGTSALDAGTRGWDWFALQLDDGRELMLYRLRLDDGRAGSVSRAARSSTRDGRAEHLAVGDFTVTPTRTWRSHAQWRDVSGRVETCDVPKAGLHSAGHVRPSTRRNCGRGVRRT